MMIFEVPLLKYLKISVPSLIIQLLSLNLLDFCNYWLLESVPL